jgi:hypothetical protein
MERGSKTALVALMMVARRVRKPKSSVGSHFPIATILRTRPMHLGSGELDFLESRLLAEPFH